MKAVKWQGRNVRLLRDKVLIQALKWIISTRKCMCEDTTILLRFVYTWCLTREFVASRLMD